MIRDRQTSLPTGLMYVMVLCNLQSQEKIMHVNKSRLREGLVPLRDVVTRNYYF